MPRTIEKEAIGRGSTVDKEDGTRERRTDEYILIKEGKCVGLGSSCRKLYKLEIVILIVTAVTLTSEMICPLILNVLLLATRCLQFRIDWIIVL
jgi:hypothetical protein